MAPGSGTRYGRAIDGKPAVTSVSTLERATRIELAFSAWEADVRAFTTSVSFAKSLVRRHPPLTTRDRWCPVGTIPCHCYWHAVGTALSRRQCRDGSSSTLPTSTSGSGARKAAHGARPL